MASAERAPRRYSDARMYGLAQALNNSEYTFVRGVRPSVLRVARTPLTLHFDLGNFSGPEALGEPARTRPIKLYNPSLVPAPKDLCPRCAFVAAVRADALHQCDEQSPLFKKQTKRLGAAAFFKSTAIVALDARLRVLGWTWFLSQPQKQVASWSPHERTHVPVGAADGFPPPWAQQVYDTRLLNLDGRHLFATYNCAACKYSISQMHLTREIAPDGGLRSLRAWASYRHQIHEKWLQGRNQALFATPPPKAAILVQPWIGLIGSFGAPQFARVVESCYGLDYDAMPIGRKHAHRLRCGSNPRNSSPAIDVVDNIRRRRDGFGAPRLLLSGEDEEDLAARALESALKAGCAHRRRAAGAHCKRLSELARQPSNDNADADAFPEANETKAMEFAEAMETGAPVGAVSAGAGVRISATANLVRIHRAGQPGRSSCTAFLGIGHLHRGEGEINKKRRRWDSILRRRAKDRAQRGSESPGRRLREGRRRFGRDKNGRLREFPASASPGFLAKMEQMKKYAANVHRITNPGGDGERADDPREHAFKFGFRYTHFFYVLSLHPPHRLIGTSDEFCIGAAQDPNDCESVQFVSGLALAEGSNDGSFRPLQPGDPPPASDATLLLSYGVNDCEAKVAEMPLARVWRMLRPLNGTEEGSVCI